MSSNVILINKLSDWTDLDNALIGEAEGFISSVSRLKMIEELNFNSSIIEIVMSTLYGQADLALEIFWKDNKKRSDKDVGAIVAFAIGTDVIAPDDSVDPFAWLLQKPDGTSELISLNIEILDEEQIVEYKIAEQDAAPNP